MTFALIPAAGQSTRMGRPKLALSLGGRTVLEHVLGALRQAGVRHLLVVVGPHVPELVPPAEAGGAHVLQLPGETPDMRATVERGLAWLEDHFHPQAGDNWLLVPADHPTLDPAVVRQLLQGREAHPGRSIIVPTFRGRRGHPVLLGWNHLAGIRALAPGQGLNVYLRQRREETLELPVASPEVLRDLDTPEDYQRLQEKGSVFFPS
jgi:molybdenum cofactor cytidylyltransferase